MAFKNKGYNWTEVEPAGTSKMLEPGGYVAQITAVEDVESREYREGIRYGLYGY